MLWVVLGHSFCRRVKADFIPEGSYEQMLTRVWFLTLVSQWHDLLISPEPLKCEKMIKVGLLTLIDKAVAQNNYTSLLTELQLHSHGQTASLMGNW